MEKKQKFLLQEEEINLIKLLRYKYRFGEITITIRDGVPHRIRKTENFDITKGDLKKTNPQIDWEFLKKCDGE